MVQVSRELEKECVVVFDEAHNIDNVCIEALSVNLREQTLSNATRNLGALTAAIQRAKQHDASRLQVRLPCHVTQIQISQWHRSLAVA